MALIGKLLQAYTLRRQLAGVLTVGILGTTLCAFMVSSWLSTERMRSDLISQGLRITDNLARQSQLALLTAAPENVEPAVDASLAFPGVIGVAIRQADGRPLLNLGNRVPGAQFPEQPAASGLILAAENEQAWLFVAPVHSAPASGSPFDVQSSSPERLGQVAVTMSKAALTRMTRDLLFANLLGAAFFIVVFVLLARYLTYRATRPLNQLSDAMARAEGGEKNVRATPSGAKDVAAMAVAFNKMLEVLEEREAELLTARDRALEYGRLKAEFAATVSHEVRTPMNGVIGMLDLLKSMKLPRQQREFVDVAWSSARSLLDLINDILDFSKLDAGKMALERREFELRKIIEDLLDLFAVQAHQKGLELGYLIAPEVPRHVLGDAKRLRQILANLLGNAVKFTERGEIAVRVSVPAETPASLRFEVIDSGIGIDAATQARLFESFAQADPSTTRKYGGTGLGLAISRQLVSLMGGEIGVDSEPGRGSRFWFSLPCTAVESVTQTAAPLARWSVLLVEDSQIERDFLVQTLRGWGLSCQALTSSLKALAMLRDAAQRGTPHDLLIMDAPYALATQGELAYQVRNDPALAGTRIMIMDKLGSEASDEAAAFWGVDAYLAKPVHQDSLRERLLELMQPTLKLPDGHANVAPAARVCRALIVEDNRTNQAVAAGMLGMLGCQHSLASSGQEALEILRGDSFDLILMDCNMPGMDGYEATARIRVMEDEEGRRTPIVAMTANTRQVDVEKCLAAGMDEHLAKPLTLEAMAAVIKRWTGQEVVVRTVSDGERAQGGPVDRDMLVKLRAALGEAIGQAIDPFLEDTPSSLSQLTSALAGQNFERAHRLAHAIKGSAGNLGALRLAALARQVEERALAGLPPGQSDWRETMQEEFEAVKAVLSRELRRKATSPERPTRDTALVLVVDDDRSTRAALRYTLQHDGLRVEEAADGAQALEMIERIAPDVVLMDALMPVLDGFGACAKLQESAGHKPPVLMITALDDNDSITRAFAAGAADYIAKPVHLGVVSQRVRRIIESSRAERHVRHLAYNDTLTGLSNRAMFMDQLARRIEHAREHSQLLAVLFLDLDRFKMVNDSLGHDIGDRLLVSVAKRIRHCVRGSDTVARFGGDEFTILIEDIVNPASAATVAAGKIRRALAAPFELDGHDIFVTTSIGIALFPNDGGDANALLKHADTAMYQAKRSNSGFALYEAEMESVVSERMLLDNALRRALERNELSVYYQPKQNLGDGLIHGMEALLRWHHPQLGMVSPAEFIPIAEDTGLILPIGEWVLRQACLQTRQWNRDGQPPLSVAVNLSGLQLKQPNFVEQVAAILAETGLPPTLLELEITESMLMQQADEALLVLSRLKEIGVRLSIDDFGTGYSSLAYLKRFPVDTLKIDRSFVRDVTSDPDAAAIANGIIALAHSLRLDVIAEGVETVEQREFLRAAGCDVIQGFLLAKPMPATEFLALLPART